MPDLFLQEMLKGNEPLNRFINEIDKEIDERVKLEQFNGNDLVSPIMQKEKFRGEMKKELEFPEIAPRIQVAIQLLYDADQLDSKEKEKIIINLSHARKIINQLNEKSTTDDNLKTTFEISDESMESILNLALKKLDNHELDNSLALFILLVTLASENADYCYRAGIVAQMTEQYELALQLYAASELIEAKILMVDCYIKLGDKDRARELYNEVSEQRHSIDEVFNNLLFKLDEALWQ